jgi:hypothetical protein
MAEGPDSDAKLVALEDQSDPVCKAVALWRADKARQTALERQWQEREHKLMQKRRAMGVGLKDVGENDCAEAQEMADLMQEIKAIDAKLARAAADLIAMPASGAAGALALIELGLAIQEPRDCEEHAWALLRRGADQLRNLLHPEAASANLRGASAPSAPKP